VSASHRSREHVASRLVPLGFALAALAFASCGDDPGVAPASGGSGGGGYDGSSSQGSTASTSTTTSTGGGGDGGVAPVWAPLGVVNGCTLERIQNASEVSIGYFEPCPDVADCEQFVFHERWRLDDTPFTAHISVASARSTEHGPVVALTISSTYDGPAHHGVFLRDDGSLIDAYRLQALPSGECGGGITSIGPDRYGFVVEHYTSDISQQLGGVLAPLDGSEPPTLFDIEPTPNGVGPQIWFSMGDSRWLWLYATNRLDSVSTMDGGDYQTITHAYPYGPFYYVKRTSSTGPLFLIEVIELPQGQQGPAQWTIQITDGVSPPAPYLVAPDGSSYAAAGYAGTHVGFYRGHGYIDGSEFQNVEVWATPYDPDPQNLAPYKVDDYPAKFLHMETIWGDGLMATGYDGVDTWDQTVVWDLATTERWFFPMVDGRSIWRPVGIIAGKVWVAGRLPMTNHADRLVRYTVR
jgi:hypothetical protein